MKNLIIVFCFFVFLFININSEECTNFDELNKCPSPDVYEYPAEWESRRFQIPPRGHREWIKNYQDMNYILGYVQQKYSSDFSKVTLTFIYQINNNNFLFSYPIFMFGDKETKRNTIEITKEEGKKYEGGMKVSAKLVDYLGHTLGKIELDPVYFIWNVKEMEDSEVFENGQKGAIVEFFGWPYNDIKEECNFISRAGYMGIRTSPPSENIESYEQVEDGELNPWFFIYQPVSYRLVSRMGTREELIDMINECRSYNVRVYADVILYHMSANGKDINKNHRNLNKDGTCEKWGAYSSSGNSPWYTFGGLYEENEITKEKYGLEYPAVPYGPRDFHCQRELTDYASKIDLNYGWLQGLTDLNTESEYVQQRIADYLTNLLSIGYTGFRVGGAKHLSPESISRILLKLKTNMGGTFPEDFMIYLEILIGGEKELLMCNETSGYNYGPGLTKILQADGFTEGEIKQIKIWASDYPKEFPICGHLVVPPERLVIQLDSHDDQFKGSSSRDMSDKGSVLVLEKNVARHRKFNEALFNYKDYDIKLRIVLSSYSFNGEAKGFPDGKSDCSQCLTDNCKSKCTKSMPYSKAHDSQSRGYDCGSESEFKGGVYTRVHRDFTIVCAMRDWMNLEQVTEEELYSEEENLKKRTALKRKKK